MSFQKCCGCSRTQNCILLSEYAKSWLSRKRKLKETTRSTYKKYLTQYIIPDLGQKKVDEISPADVQAMLDKHKKLSAKTLKEMNMLIVPGEGYIPEYTRTDLTDHLHDVFGFRTDYEIISQRNMKKILTATRK